MLDWWREIRKPAVMRITVNPNDRVTAEKLVSCGLFDKHEANKAFTAFDRMRKRPKLPTVKAFFDAMRCNKSEFAVQVLLLPRQLTDRLLPAEVDTLQITFAEFSVAVWLLCSFDLATLAFSMMDTRGLGRVTRDQVRDAVKTVYATGNKNLKARLEGNSKSSIDAKLIRLLDGFGLELSKQDFLELTSKYHYLLLPAFQLQRAVRDTVFGPTVADWQRLEGRRRGLVAGRTVQQVIRHLATQLPDLQACVPNDTDIYKFECQKQRVLDHAVRAYREGNYQRAKTVYGHYEKFDPKAHDLHQPDGKFQKSEALTIMSIDQPHSSRDFRRRRSAK